MREYIVKQGDCISSIAYRFNLLPDSIWNDPANAKLKAKREDPNVLLPGDVVYLRYKEIKEVSRSTEQRHRFRRKGVPERLVVQFKVYDEPRANEAYVSEIDGDLSEGKTDENGKVEIPIPPNAKKGKISFRDNGDEYELELGKLDPVTELSGIQARLQNLGFYNEPVDGEMSDEFGMAICNFQKANKLEPTGELDEQTRNKIQEIFGG